MHKICIVKTNRVEREMFTRDYKYTDKLHLYTAGNKNVQFNTTVLLLSKLANLLDKINVY